MPIYFGGQVAGVAASTVAGAAAIGGASRTILGAGRLFKAGEAVAESTRAPVFWAGEGTQAAAEKLAAETGANTLGMTAQGQGALEETAGLAWSEAKPIWAKASADLAERAVSTAHVFQSAASVGLSSIWAETEFPILVRNGVDIVYHVVGMG
jgi:hypothetical protein